MRKCLARRRWYRLLNAVRVMGCMRLGKAKDLLILRKFVRRIVDSKLKIVTDQIFKKAANLGSYLGSASHSGSPGSQGIHAWVEDNSKPGIVSSSSSEDDCLIDDDDDVVVLPANNRNTSTTPGAFPSR